MDLNFSKEDLAFRDEVKEFLDKDYPKNIKDKINSDYKRGWGMSLMKDLMDTVEIVQDDEGCTVIMTKRRKYYGL